MSSESSTQESPDPVPAPEASEDSPAVSVDGWTFPIRGSHNYGGADNRYGAPRAGHRHAGQDVLAPCGTPLVAARGGKVVEAGYEGAGGNAVVIHGSGSSYDQSDYQGGTQQPRSGSQQQGNGANESY